MKRSITSLVLLGAAALTACTASNIFSPDTLKGVDPNFDFAHWRMVPNQADAKKIQLGGRIVQAETKGESITVVTAQLPIVEHPAYGPKDTGKRSGEFAVVYQGKIDSSFLHPGNRIMVVGTTQAPRVVSVDDLPKSLPTVLATCVHLWKTGGREIAEFPSLGGGYTPLEEETFCAATK
jgi:starvation-inducible outer membrane lipoprotein